MNKQEAVDFSNIDYIKLLEQPYRYIEAPVENFEFRELFDFCSNFNLSEKEVDEEMLFCEHENYEKLSYEKRINLIKNFREVINNKNFTQNFLKDSVNYHYGAKKPIQLEKFISLNDLMSLDLQQKKWLIKDVIKENSISMIFGEYKSSKSFLAMLLALCIANGVNLLGFENETKESQRVLYVDEEMGLDILKDRFSRLAKGMNLRTNNIDLLVFQDVKLQGRSSPGWKVTLRDYIEKINPKLIIVDSIVRVMEGDENSSKDVREVFGFMKQFKAKCSWLLLHHTAKGGETGRGSGDFGAMVDDSFILKPVGRKKEHRFVLKTHRSRGASVIEGFEYMIDGEENEPLVFRAIDSTNDSSLVSSLGVEITAWILKSDIREFRRKNLPKEIKDLPYQRVTDTLKMLDNLEVINSHGSRALTRYVVNPEKAKEHYNKSEQIIEC